MSERSFHVLAEDYLGYIAGTKLYMMKGHDYGVASDDTRLLGEPCRSWSVLPDGGYPFVSVPDRLLKATPEQSDV